MEPDPPVNYSLSQVALKFLMAKFRSLETFPNLILQNSEER